MSVGKTINVVVMLHGGVHTWGRPDYTRVKFDDLKQFSRPMSIPSRVKFRSVSMGYNHCFLIDDSSKLWGFGDNEMGSLGMGDWKKRLAP